MFKPCRKGEREEADAVREASASSTLLLGAIDGLCKVCDGKAWTPNVTVKGGTSGFYSIGVKK